jgi:branched-chain amino acid transport system substrate-binding protein
MKKKLPPKLAWLIIFFLPLVFSACRNWPGEQEIIHIAFVGALSGEGASDSESILRGINLHIERINAQGGIQGKKIVLDVYDDQNNPEKASLRAREIVTQNRAVAVIGHNNSSCSISAGDVYKENGIPAITSVSTNVNVTRNNEWYFRTIYNDDFQGKFLATYARRAFDEKTVSIIHEDDPYGFQLAQNFEETAGEIGLDVGFSREFNRNDSNLDRTLEKIIAELRTLDDPGLIFLSVHAPEGVKLIKLLRDSGFENSILARFSQRKNDPRLLHQRGLYLLPAVI